MRRQRVDETSAVVIPLTTREMVERYAELLKTPSDHKSEIDPSMSVSEASRRYAELVRWDKHIIANMKRDEK